MTSAVQERVRPVRLASRGLGEDADSGRSVLARAFLLLQAFSADRPVRSLGELAEFANLPKSTTHRIAAVLVGCGALQRHGKLGYSVGAWLHDLGMLSPARARLMAASTPFIHELHEQTHATVHLGILAASGPLCLDKIGGYAGPALFTRPGSSFPAHSTALGKCLLAMDRDASRAVLGGPALRRYTQRTMVAPRHLAAELVRVKEEHLGHDSEETVDGITCVAAPILDRFGECVAAISVSAPTSRIRQRPTTVLVQRAADNVERALGREASSA